MEKDSTLQAISRDIEIEKPTTRMLKMATSCSLVISMLKRQGLGPSNSGTKDSALHNTISVVY